MSWCWKYRIYGSRCPEGTYSRDITAVSSCKQLQTFCFNRIFSDRQLASTKKNPKTGIISESVQTNCRLFGDLGMIAEKLCNAAGWSAFQSNQLLLKHILACGCFSLNRNTEQESSENCAFVYSNEECSFGGKNAGCKLWMCILHKSSLQRPTILQVRLQEKWRTVFIVSGQSEMRTITLVAQYRWMAH